MKKKYWAVRVENVTRISDKCETAEQAAKYCFGYISENMVAVPYPKKPCYMTQAAKREILTQLDLLQSKSAGERKIEEKVVTKDGLYHALRNADSKLSKAAATEWQVMLKSMSNHANEDEKAAIEVLLAGINSFVDEL